ncbi:MAG: hypothetical protein AAF957_23840 [Planctomycetota bacterium]
MTLAPLLSLPGLAAGALALAVPVSLQETSEAPIAPELRPAEPKTPEEWRARERELLRRIDELEALLRDEQERSYLRQQEWIDYSRVLGDFELPSLPAPPEFIADALVEPPDPAAEAAAREAARLRVRAREIDRKLATLFAVESIGGIDLLEIGLLHEHEGRTWTGPVIARLIDGRGRMVGMLKASHMRLEASRASHTVTIVLKDGYESRAGALRPFEGGRLVAAPDEGGESDEMVATGGVRRIFLGAVDPGPWIDAAPELVDPEMLQPVVDDGVWDRTAVRIDIARLLRRAGEAGDPSWRLVALGGIRGKDLRDVRFTEVDDLTGRTQRIVFADAARVFARDGGGVEILLEGGTVRRGDRVAPFLAGRYRIVLPRADAATWKDARVPGLAPAPLPAGLQPEDDGPSDEETAAKDGGNGRPPIR